MLEFEAACGSFLGNGRSKNEDNFVFNRKHLPAVNKGLKRPVYMHGDTREPVIMGVFDGMGGAKNGHEAACLASEVFVKEQKQLEEIVMSGKEFLYRACASANTAVNAYAKKAQLTATGTTAAVLHFLQDEVVACNVGDSKIFRIREKQMLQISEDHTDEKIMSAMGIQKKPVLLQYIGVPETDMLIDPYITKGDLARGDIYVACSDGVTDAVSYEELYDIVCANSAREAVVQLLAAVDKHNGSDNATAIVVKF